MMKVIEDNDTPKDYPFCPVCGAEWKGHERDSKRKLSHDFFHKFKQKDHGDKTKYDKSQRRKNKVKDKSK